MIAFITKFKGLEESVAVIHKFEKTYSRQKNSILRDGVSCFNPNIVKQKDFALDFMNFPPDGKNNSFGLQTGANGSFAIRNPCINLMNKTTMMALQSLGFVTPSAVENRMNSLIVFDVHPFRYPSNCFSGGPKTIPLPEFLKDENQQSAQRDFENVLTHWKQICTEVVKHLEEKSEGKVQVTEFGSYARRFTDGINLTREANHSCHPHYILASYADEESQIKFIKSIYCTMGDNEQVNLQSVVEGVFSIFFKKMLICPSTMPKDSPEFITWLESLPQCKPKDHPDFIAWLESLPQCKPKDHPDFFAWLESLPQRKPKDSQEYKDWLEKLLDSLPQCKPKDHPDFIAWLESLPQRKPKDSPEYKDWLEKLLDSFPQRKPKDHPDFIAWLESLPLHGIPFDERMEELEEYKDLFKDCNVSHTIEGYDMNLSEVGYITCGKQRKEREP